jgi:hypothetical protein
VAAQKQAAVADIGIACAHSLHRQGLYNESTCSSSKRRVVATHELA